MIHNKKASRSYDQAKLKYISDLLCDDIDMLLPALGIDSYRNLGKMISCSCPVHGGDNDSALNLYHQGDHYRGNWKCRTHQCELVFKSSIIGFIRGCLSHNLHGWSKEGDPLCSFQEALDFATSFLKQDFDKIRISKKNKEKNTFVNTVKYIASTQQTRGPTITRQAIKQSLSIPSRYFIDRGFDTKTLEQYDVGDCTNPDKEMYNRAVVPIYDNDHKYMVGCTGRSIHSRCSTCKAYHSSDKQCPSSENLWKYSKWKHNSGFKTQEYLYNYWLAKDKIIETSAVILVESPGNVWRLYEAGITNVVAIFGSSLGDRQKMILDSSGAMAIITIMDNDDAGKKAAAQIKQKCSKTYNIIDVAIYKEDIAAMSVAEIHQDIVPRIRQYI